MGEAVDSVDHEEKMVKVYWTMRKKVTATTMSMFLGALQITMGMTATMPIAGIMSTGMKTYLCF